MAIACEPKFTPSDNADFLDLVAADIAATGRSGRAKALHAIADEHRRMADALAAPAPTSEVATNG